MVYYLLNYGGGAISNIKASSFQNYIPFAILLGMTGAYYFKKKMLRSAVKAKKVEDKIEIYKKMFVVQMACLEAPALLCIVASLLTGEPNFLLIGVAIVAVILFRRPTAEKVSLETGISSQA